jgi:hypothetical protein
MRVILPLCGNLRLHGVRVYAGLRRVLSGIDEHAATELAVAAAVVDLAENEASVRQTTHALPSATVGTDRRATSNGSRRRA